MKWLRAALAAYILIAPVAQARVAFIIDRDANLQGSTTLALRSNALTVLQVSASYAASFINKYNPGTIDIYTADKVWTQLIKNGKVSVSDRGSTTGPYKTYSAVFWFNGAGMAAANNSYHVGCAACSLTFISNSGTAAVPTVPQLHIGFGIGAESPFTHGVTCSTNVVAATMDPGSQGPDYFDWRTHLLGSTKGWPQSPMNQPQVDCFDNAGTTARASGTARVLLGSDEGNQTSIYLSSTLRHPYPAWRDSISTFGPTNPGFVAAAYMAAATGPTWGTIVNIRYNDNFSGAAPNVFCSLGQHHVPPIGGGTTANVDERVQIDPTPLYISIAWLDSLTNHAILGTNIEPARLAVQVSGGFRRGLNTSSGGFAPYDSVSVGYGCDSLKAAVGIPLAIGADPESIGTYASDKALWQRAGAVRFALESSRGSTADTSAVVLGNVSAGTYVPSIIDPFGRYRSRAFVGATSDTTDTSMASILKRGKLLLASRLGISTSQIDKVVIASGDDYSPRNWNNGGADSVALALAAAGFSGVSQNADDSLSISTAGNHWGYGSNQKSVRNAMFLSFPGFNGRGATYGNGSIGSDGTGTGCDSSWCISYTKRTLSGLYQNWWEAPQNYHWLKNSGEAAMPPGGLWWNEPGTHAEISPLSNLRTGVNLVRITASSLGSGDLVSTPNMPGFYQLKYLKYQVDAINSFGRTLIQFVYPDGLGPRDIRR